MASVSSLCRVQISAPVSTKNERVMSDDNNNHQRVVAIVCPVCKKKFHTDGREGIVATQYLIPTPPGVPQQMSFPKLCCTACGVEFFPENVLAKIRENVKGGQSKIIIPQANLKLVQ